MQYLTFYKGDYYFVVSQLEKKYNFFDFVQVLWKLTHNSETIQNAHKNKLRAL